MLFYCLHGYLEEIKPLPQVFKTSTKMKNKNTITKLSKGYGVKLFGVINSLEYIPNIPIAEYIPNIPIALRTNKINKNVVRFLNKKKTQTHTQMSREVVGSNPNHSTIVVIYLQEQA